LRGLRRSRAGAGGDDYVGGKLDPLAFIVDAGEGVNGANDVGAVSTRNAFGAIDDVAQGEAKIGIANGKEIEGVGAAVDRTTLNAIEVFHRARPGWLAGDARRLSWSCAVGVRGWNFAALLRGAKNCGELCEAG